MHAYSKWEWRIMRVGLFSMTGLAMIFMMVGLAALAVENRTGICAAAAGLSVASAIGAVTTITLHIMGRRNRRSRQP